MHIRLVAENLAQEVLAAVLIEDQLSMVWRLVVIRVHKTKDRNGFIVAPDRDHSRFPLRNRVSTRGKQLVAHGKIEGDGRLNPPGLCERCAGHDKICHGEESGCCDPFHDSVSFQ